MHAQSVVTRLVGTAIDLRIRAYFHCNIHRSEWVKRGLEFLQDLGEFPAKPLMASFEKFIAKARPERRQLHPRTEERLCRYCIIFAYLEWIGRAPFSNSADKILLSISAPNISEMLSRLDLVIVKDVLGLSEIFYNRHSKLLTKPRKVICQGTLAGSEDVGGADFDLLVDGCLFDFKATRKPTIRLDYLRQLIGYWLLDYKDERKIRSVALSLLRHGHTQYFDIRHDLLQTDISFAALRTSFRKELRRLRTEQIE